MAALVRGKKIAVLVFSLLLFTQGVKAQVVVSPNQTALAMATKLAGQGITILNPVLTCSPYAGGFFTISSTAMQLDSGIVLTTGSMYSIGGYAANNASTNNGTPGDPQLAALAGSTTHDACKLEFDVIPKGDTLKFDYVFGSEEYNNATCGPYNDAFSFFISGPGIVGSVNMALVPGTAIPVAVNSINNGIPGSQGGNMANCTAMGAGSPFTSYYIDNTNGTVLTYKGFTQVLTAMHAVQPCSTYHLKLTIADAGNALYDSGVFLKAGSLKANTFTIKATGGSGISNDKALIAKGCPPATITVKRNGKRPTAQTLKYLISGTGIKGTDYTNITDSVIIAANDSVATFSIAALLAQPGGPKTIKLRLLSPFACNGQEVIDSAQIIIADVPYIRILTADTTVCKGTPMQIRAVSSAGLSYSWAGGKVNYDTALSPIAIPEGNTKYVVTGTLPGSGCPAVRDTLSVQIKQTLEVSAGPDKGSCNGASVTINATVQPAGGNYSYQWNLPSGTMSNGDKVVISTATAADNGTYVITVSDGVCVGRDSMRLTVHSIPASPTVRSPFVLCLHGDELSVPANGTNLLWYQLPQGGLGSSESPRPSTADTGRYTYYVSQTVDGCESGRAAVDVAVEKCCGDEMIIPTAFTPNGDGRNETFGLGNIAANVTYHLRVFNRWGQQIYHGIQGDRWDGTEHGRPAASGVYFYDVQINCTNGNIVERKGDLTLIR